uniref:Uncharacterized protein n=1 Tax=Erythrolobus madagascarensis TaxID=708628 RepID=A0A7S0XJP4_9RHOD|mmetsp:Transcript_4620/g.9916  ORF Transcript_4620/g.9916 Transcript_4620/m.9916 type:complete len:1064 (+) Transcript_4620:71-3262(+)
MENSKAKNDRRVHPLNETVNTAAAAISKPLGFCVNTTDSAVIRVSAVKQQESIHADDGLDEMEQLGVASLSNSRAVSSTLCSSPRSLRLPAAKITDETDDDPLASQLAHADLGALQNDGRIETHDDRHLSSSRSSSRRLMGKNKSSGLTSCHSGENGAPGVCGEGPSRGVSMLSSLFGGRSASAKLRAAMLRVRDSTRVSVDPVVLLRRFELPMDPTAPMTVAATASTWYDRNSAYWTDPAPSGTQYGPGGGSCEAPKNSAGEGTTILRTFSSLFVSASPALTPVPNTKDRIGEARAPVHGTVSLKTVRTNGGRIVSVGLVRGSRSETSTQGEIEGKVCETKRVECLEEDAESAYDEYENSDDAFDEEEERVEDAFPQKTGDSEQVEEDGSERTYAELIELAEQTSMVALTQTTIEVFASCGTRKILESRLHVSWQSATPLAQRPLVDQPSSVCSVSRGNDPLAPSDLEAEPNGTEIAGTEVMQTGLTHQASIKSNSSSGVVPQVEWTHLGGIGNPQVVRATSGVFCGEISCRKSGDSTGCFDSVLVAHEDGVLRCYSLTSGTMGRLRSTCSTMSGKALDHAQVRAMVRCGRLSESSHGDIVALGCGDGQVRFVDTSTLCQPESLSRVHQPSALAWSSVGSIRPQVAAVALDASHAWWSQSAESGRGCVSELALGYSDGSVGRVSDGSVTPNPIAHSGAAGPSVACLAYGALIVSVCHVDWALVVTHAVNGTPLARRLLSFAPSCIRRPSLYASTAGPLACRTRLAQVKALITLTATGETARGVGVRLLAVSGSQNCVLVGGSQGELELYRITACHTQRAEIRCLLRIRERARGREVAIRDVVFDHRLRMLVAASADGSLRRWIFGTEHERLVGTLKCGVGDLQEHPMETRIGAFAPVMEAQAKLAEALDPALALNSDEMDHLVEEFEAAQLEAQTAVTHADSALRQTRAVLRAKYEYFMRDFQQGNGSSHVAGVLADARIGGDENGEANQKLQCAALESFLYEMRFASVQHAAVVEEIVRKLSLRLRKSIVVVLSAAVSRETEPRPALTDTLAAFQAALSKN